MRVKGMKFVFQVILALLLSLNLCLPVCAAEADNVQPEQTAAASAAAIQPGSTAPAGTVLAATTTTDVATAIATASPARPMPSNIETKDEDGVRYLVKTYETAAGFDPSILKEDGFEKDGFLYAYMKTDKKDNFDSEKKDTTETVSVKTSSKDMTDILKRLPSTKDYSDNGFSGTLALDTNSISTDVSGYKTNSWYVTDVRDYPCLMYEDPTYVPQTSQKDGYTLPLTDIQWAVTGTSLAGDTLVPTEYTATATYSKKVSQDVPAGYVTTAVYKGTVSKSVVESVTYTVTFIGTPIFVPTSMPIPIPSKPQREFPTAMVFTILAALLVLGGLGTGGYFLFKNVLSLKDVKIYNLIEHDYVCLGKQTLDMDKPVVNLNSFKDEIQSSSFSFVLNKSASKKLYGRNIAVTLDDVTVMHRVSGYNEEYRFNLELGGVLDAQ
jgi:hypothetical protein